ncbi:threonine synthase [Bacillus sp. FSL K6-3431]|uniref:threonine synthase n=1 Tax=Bacillus sp. FSL K6-3431 TaxID=2921500 RepID=UPI0030F7A1E2
MKYSYATHLYCPKCSLTYEIIVIQQVCTCGAPLLVKYDLTTLAMELDSQKIKGRQNDLWRYHELLPIQRKENIVSMGEGMTPIIPMNKMAVDMGLEHLYMKDEGIMPTGTFKARGAAVGISKAKELGVKELAMPTNGNAGAAWSLYATRAGITTTIVMPVNAPIITRNECAVSGANVYLVNGLISDAGEIVAEAVNKFGLFDASTLREPYRIEGKKTMGLELAEQFNWELPEVILYPTGGGVGLIGIYKALKELHELGWLAKEQMPRLVAVQADGCAPIVKAWEEGKSESEFWPDSETIAFGINVPKASGDFLVLEALYETNGCAISVNDQEIISEQRNIAQKEGTFICPEGAAAFLAARRLRKSGWIKENDKVVVLNTGSGLIYPDTVEFDVPTLNIGESIKSTSHDHC